MVILNIYIYIRNTEIHTDKMIGCFEFQERGDINETRLAVNWKWLRVDISS